MKKGMNFRFIPFLEIPISTRECFGLFAEECLLKRLSWREFDAAAICRGVHVKTGFFQTRGVEENLDVFVGTHDGVHGQRRRLTIGADGE